MKTKAARLLFGVLAFVLTTVVFSFAYGLFIESKSLEIFHIDVPQGEFKSDLTGKTAIHLTDIHLREEGAFEQHLLETVRSLDPDFIFLTGDYVTWEGDYEIAFDFLRKLKAKEGVWAVLGDYDYSNSRKSCLFCHLPESGQKSILGNVRFLRNSIDKVQTARGEVLIIGVDEGLPSTLKNIDELFAAEKAGASASPAIILSHSPLFFDKIDLNRSVLVLAGDTHGGQVPLPGWLYRLLGYEKNAKYNYGLFKDGSKTMYVSRGIGTSHLPIRLFRKPEIVVLQF